MSSQDTIYRSARRADLTSRATQGAVVIAAVLAAVGAISMIVGVVGVVDVSQVGAVRSALYLGLGLTAIGSGGFLLLILQGLRGR